MVFNSIKHIFCYSLFILFLIILRLLYYSALNVLTRNNNFRVIVVSTACTLFYAAQRDILSKLYNGRWTIKPDSSRSIYIKSTISRTLSHELFTLPVAFRTYNCPIISRRGSCQNRLEFLMARTKDGARRERVVS